MSDREAEYASLKAQVDELYHILREAATYPKMAGGVVWPAPNMDKERKEYAELKSRLKQLE